LDGGVDGGPIDRRVVGSVMREVGTRFHDVALVATREAERRAELAELAPEVLDIPSFGTDINDLRGLMALVSALRG
jgi:hypothetical protein